MKREEFYKNYWRYYCMLEKKFLTTVDFVEIDEKNFCCYSNEYALLLQSIGAELDNIFKLYCDFDLTKRKTILNYANTLLNDTPEITKQIVKVAGTDIELVPFKEWTIESPSKSLKWWVAFTNIKHNRNGNFVDAKQENVINILSALFILENMCLRKFAKVGTDGVLVEPDAPDEPSKLFSLVDWNYRFIPIAEGLAIIDDGLCPY